MFSKALHAQLTSFYYGPLLIDVRLFHLRTLRCHMSSFRADVAVSFPIAGGGFRGCVCSKKIVRLLGLVSWLQLGFNYT